MAKMPANLFKDGKSGAKAGAKKNGAPPSKNSKQDFKKNAGMGPKKAMNPFA